MFQLPNQCWSVSPNFEVELLAAVSRSQLSKIMNYRTLKTLEQWIGDNPDAVPQHIKEAVMSATVAAGPSGNISEAREDE